MLDSAPMLGLALNRLSDWLWSINAERSAAYFCIPAAQVVEIGIEIEI